MAGLVASRGRVQPVSARRRPVVHRVGLERAAQSSGRQVAVHEADAV